MLPNSQLSRVLPTSPLSSIFMLSESILEFFQRTFDYHTETGPGTAEAEQLPKPPRVGCLFLAAKGQVPGQP